MTSAGVPLVSFVVPCYNYGKFLPDCFSSIFRQEGDYSFEIVAIDDASTDDTWQVLTQFRDPRLRALRHSGNQGHIKTITEGLLESRGELVARIDPDDRYRPCFLKETVPRFEAHPEVGLVYGDAAVIDSAGNITAPSVDRHHRGRDFKGNEYIALLEDNFIYAPTVIARRAAWLETLPVPPYLAFSDWYFNLMMARRHEFYFINRVLAEYRFHGGNHHARVLRDKSAESSIRDLLNGLFSESEALPELESAKQKARRHVYAAQLWRLANGYFDAGMYQDARRCYLETMACQPRKILSPALQYRLFGTLIGQRAYDSVKRLVRAVAKP